MIHSFLLIGQSNMAGRGDMEEAKPLDGDRIKVLRNGRWQSAYRPINPDRDFSGVCLAESFANRYAEEHNVEVGLIPCADGGTSLDQWCVGGLLYDNAVNQARLANRTSTIVGVLWHQGESECKYGLCDKYEKKFTKIMNSLRKDLDLHDVPFILGGISDFLKINERFPDECIETVNKSLKLIAERNSYTGFASAQGLTDKGDLLHFDTKSLEIFGNRYYDVFKILEKKDRVFVEKATVDSAIRTELDAL